MSEEKIYSRVEEIYPHVFKIYSRVVMIYMSDPKNYLSVLFGISHEHLKSLTEENK